MRVVFCAGMALLYRLRGVGLVEAQVNQSEPGCLLDEAGGNIAVGLGLGLGNVVLSDTHECLCECVEQKTKTSQIFEIIGHLI